jgi:hypothetical protein
MTRYIVVEPEKERLLEDLVAFRKRKTANSCHCVVVLHFTLTQQCVAPLKRCKFLFFLFYT